MTTRTSKKRIGLVHGFRSGLEEQIASQLAAAGIKVEYEALKIKYEKPARISSYSPDFVLPNGIVVKSKGRYVTEDRQKHLLIKKQHPNIDIRFVFSNSRSRISKQSSTTYADWCLKNGFAFSDKRIPEAWLKEPANHASIEALRSMR